MKRASVPDGLAKEVCNRLGTELPSTPAGVDELFHAWCSHVPFDGIAKAIALREDREPPGTEPAAFCEQWLATGVGGLCWPLLTGLAAVLGAAGVETTFGVERRLVDFVDFHGILVLRDAGEPELLDVVHVSGGRLAIRDGARGTHGAYASGIRADGERLLHWSVNPESPTDPMEYSVHATTLDLDDVAAFSALSRAFTGVQVRRLYQRRSDKDWIAYARPAPEGDALLVQRWTADGCRETRHDPEAGLAALGYQPSALPLLERAGFLTRGPTGWRLTT